VKSAGQLFSLDGKVALVSGASRGIGLAVAQGLAQAGARVYALGRSVTPDDAQDINYQSCDVTDGADFERVCNQIYGAHDRLNVYVHAAGITLPERAQHQPLDAFAQTIEVNLIAAYRCCLTAAGYAEKSGGGSIINVTSIGSELGFPGNPGYVASKGGLRALTKALAVDLGAKNIRVNNLAPGYIRTAMTEKSYADPAKRDERMQRMILQRWGTPQDLIGAAIFLASDASAYVTGQDLFVDGGWTAKGL
jgi:NAD(P)-dependent dehydrogenase (short-subunit alcohol dehydrogenase family)